jgi:SAM-dependent methyltransferase
VSEPFGFDYAECYDALYGDKDYAAECDLIEHLFRTDGDGKISSVLDLGCGTGNHALPLAGRGYEVTGVERSADMLACARHKMNGKAPVILQQGDIRDVALGERFDAALMMFAVLGYQLHNCDVVAALTTARRHLRSDGLLIFDVWYGPAVLHQRPAPRVRVIPAPTRPIVRLASAEMDARHHRCSVRYRILRWTSSGSLTDAEEVHVMRYYFPLELELFLTSSGFTLVRLTAFPDVDRAPDETTWNCLVVAKAV